MDRLKDLDKEEREKIQKVLGQCLEKEEGILFAYLHGSFTEGRSFRDIDIGVFVEASKVPKEKGLDFEISTAIKLEAVTKMPIDVKVINYAPLSFKYEVIKGGRLILAKDDEKRVDFETSTFSYYFDFAPYRDRYLKEVLNIGD